jgi:signal transduction histidine kinase/signal recognition particle receptor subunit beta
MVQFDNQYKQVKLKIVFYGPALGGKTSCLRHIHRVTDPQRRTKLYALATASDRTLFFDLLAIDLGRVRGYRLTLQLYTVPGQVQYNTTRRAVLAGADGVVFVADSQRAQARANHESLANLGENLRANGLDPGTIPTVLLYNKRDLPDATPRSEMESALNRSSGPAFEGVAITGQGVMEAFAAVTEATVRAVADRLGLSAQPDALDRLVVNARTAMAPYVPKGSDAPGDAPVVLRPDSDSALQTPDELVAEAVRANMAMTEANTRLDRITAELERRVAQLRVINEFGRMMSLAREPEEITSGFLDRLLAELRIACGSLRLADDEGVLVEVLRRGLTADPVLRAAGGGRTLAEVVAANRVPVLVRVDERNTGEVALSGWADEIGALGLAAGMAVPLIAQDRTLGLVTCYSDTVRGSFEDSELDLATVLAANAAVALANARAWRSLEQLNRTLEDAVAARTRDLEGALTRARSLAAELEERNFALEAANRQLRELETLKGDLLDRIAHELNTPVTAIQTAARILSRHDEVPPEKAMKFVEIITQESTRLAELIASALQVVVLGVPETRPHPQPVAVSDLLRRALAPLRAEMTRLSLTVHVKVATGLEQMTGDGEQLESAIRAIAKNAVDFNRSGGSVTLIVRPVRRGGAPFVEVRVEDTGAGISAADQPHVTELFWQGGNVLTGKPHGLGLGLAVARRVADNHGGMLEIESEEGKGTAVALLVPAPRPAVG